MKKHLNRIAVDLCTPTAERRPTTAEDIRNDVFIEDFRNSEELYEFVLDLTNMSDEDVIDELGNDDSVENKIDYLLGFCMDPGDGSPNIQYCCVDGKELDSVLTYDSFDGLNFDSIDSETLVDILLDEHYYDDDDEDEWDDDEEYDEEEFWVIVYSEKDSQEEHQERYDDFDDARADFKYMVEQTPDDYEFVVLQHVIESDIDGEQIEEIERWGLD